VTTQVFVTVGTDHHPFDRLIDWVESWAGGQDDVTLLIQHGASRAARVGRNRPFLGADELAAAYRSSDVVVGQVGPGSIADANKAGLVPIVVPRDPVLGEVVDAHQFDFGYFMAAKGRAEIVTTEAGLHARLDSTLAEPAVRRLTAPLEATPAVAAVSELADALLRNPPARLRLRRVVTMLREA
jgi:UDP-N-acetylglucosamine transferase subunit ALG13